MSSIDHVKKGRTAPSRNYEELMGCKPKKTCMHKFKDGKIEEAVEVYDDNNESSDTDFEERESDCVKRSKILDDSAIIAA